MFSRVHAPVHESMASKKRKRACISLETKLKVIDEISKGQSQRHASEIFGIPKSTVADVWKLRDKIKDHVFAAEAPEEYAKWRIIRDPHFSQLDRSRYVWFTQQRSRGAPVSGPLLQEKAQQLFPSLYPNDDPSSFKASSGCLDKFCSQHGIRQIALQGESLSADSAATAPFVRELESRLKTGGYSSDQVFNADETGLW